MEIIDLPSFGVDDYAAVVDGEVDPFGTEHLPIRWRPKTGHVGLRHRGRLIGCAGWVPVDVRVDGTTVGAVGLGGVIVHRDHRGRGAGGPLVAGAMERMRATGRPLGLLFCRPERLDFYRDLGWEEVTPTVSADGEDGQPMVMPLRTCWTAFGPDVQAPSSDVHIDGLPF